MTSGARNFGVPRPAPRFFTEDFHRNRYPRTGQLIPAMAALAFCGVFLLLVLSIAGKL